MRQDRPHRRPRRESGVALLASLVMLAAISLLAVAATNSMIGQQHMAGNFGDGQRARQAAAVAIMKGEALLFGIAHDARITSCRQDCFVPPLDTIIRQTSELPDNPEFQDATWWQSWALEAGSNPVTGRGPGGAWSFDTKPPRFLIEELYFDDLEAAASITGAPSLEGIGYYRVLARGVGRGPAAVAVDEAIVARPWLAATTRDDGPSKEKAFCADFEPWYDCGLMAWRQRR